MKYTWEDLPERKNLFTVKNTAMINLNTGKAVRQYCTNTKIAVVQKCVTPEKTYYRTYDSFHNCLNHAFEAEAFGLPNEKAPSAPLSSMDIPTSSSVSASRTPKPNKKQIPVQNSESPNDGGGKRSFGWLRKLLRRKNG